MVIARAEEADWPLLEALCRASCAAWTARLREGLSPETCGDAFDCAVAFSAAAVFSDGQEGLESFSAGVVSVKIRDAASSAAALRDAAERLMTPCAVPDSLFLKGVWG